MTHQNLCLRKCWKLFWVTLTRVFSNAHQNLVTILLCPSHSFDFLSILSVVLFCGSSSKMIIHLSASENTALICTRIATCCSISKAKWENFILRFVLFLNFYGILKHGFSVLVLVNIYWFVFICRLRMPKAWKAEITRQSQSLLWTCKLNVISDSHCQRSLWSQTKLSDKAMK